MATAFLHNKKKTNKSKPKNNKMTIQRWPIFDAVRPTTTNTQTMKCIYFAIATTHFTSCEMSRNVQFSFHNMMKVYDAPQMKINAIDLYRMHKTKKKMDNKIEMKMKKKKTLMWFKLTSLSRNRDRDDRTCLSKSFFVWNIFGNFFFFSFLLCSLSEFSFVCPKRFQAIKSKHTISLSCHRKSPT